MTSCEPLDFKELIGTNFIEIKDGKRQEIKEPLLENLEDCIYADAPGLDPELEWADEEDYLDLLKDEINDDINKDSFNTKETK